MWDEEQVVLQHILVLTLYNLAAIEKDENKNIASCSRASFHIFEAIRKIRKTFQYDNRQMVVGMSESKLLLFSVIGFSQLLTLNE